MRSATAKRLRAAIGSLGQPLDPDEEARVEQIALAVISRTIAEGGRAASLHYNPCASLIRSVGADVCGSCGRQAAHMVRYEDFNYDCRLLGPS